MAAASTVASLLKYIFSDLLSELVINLIEYSFSIKHKKFNFGEVVDKNGKTLCFMPEDEILQQNLSHKRVACLLRDQSGKRLILWRDENGYGFSGAGMLAPLKSAEEYCHELLMPFVEERPITLRFLGIHLPCSQSFNAFTYVYDALIYALPEIPEALNLDRAEFGAILALGYRVCPFLQLVVESGWLYWK